MQGIVDRDAHDDRADAHHDDGDARLEQGDDRQGKDPAEEDGDTKPKQVALARHGEHQDAEYQHNGQGNGNEAVFFDLLRVGDGDSGRTHGRDMHLGMLRFGLGYHLVQQTDNLRIALGVAARERRRKEGKTFVAALVEEIFVLHAVALRRVKHIQPLQGGRIQVKRVGLDAIDDETCRGHRQHPLDIGHAGCHVVGVGEQGIHAAVVTLGKKQRLVLADEVHGVEHLAAVNFAAQVADQLCGVAFLPPLFKGIHGVHQGIEGLVANELCGVGSEDDGHPTLVAHVIVD